MLSKTDRKLLVFCELLHSTIFADEIETWVKTVEYLKDGFTWYLSKDIIINYKRSCAGVPKDMLTVISHGVSL